MRFAAYNLWILPDCPICASQNRRSRSLVLRQIHDPGIRKALQEALECSAGCPAEVIDSLIWIADRKRISLVPCEQARQVNLSVIGILKLVHQQKSAFAALLSQQLLITGQFL